MKLENLTQEQEAQMEKYKQDYLAYGRCTDRIDKASTEKAINDIYVELGKPEPLIIYCKSIMAMYLTVNVERNIGENIVQNIWQNIGQNIWENLRENIVQNIEENIERNIWQNIRQNIGRNIEENIEQNIWQNIEENIRRNIGQNLEDTLWGQHSAHWICYYIVFRDILKLEYNEKDERLLNNLDILVKSCCWWIPFDNVCIVSDRPSELKLDAQGRLHSDKDMCIKFVDGWGFHAIHGVRVPEEMIA